MSDRVTLPRGEKHEPGTWLPFGGSAVVTCPECGLSAPLGHEIADDGTVTPSLDCPNDACAWHVFVRLEGWTS